MSSKTVTCIGCPMGCKLAVSLSEKGAVETVDGAGCGRGALYAAQECMCPVRNVASLVRVQGRRAPLSVRTAQPVPKERIADCLEAIHQVTVVPPVRIGDAVLLNVCGTGVDVVATMAAEEVAP